MQDILVWIRMGIPSAFHSDIIVNQYINEAWSRMWLMEKALVSAYIFCNTKCVQNGKIIIIRQHRIILQL